MLMQVCEPRLRRVETEAGASGASRAPFPCPPVVVTGPRLVRFDLSAVKRIRLQGSTAFEFRVEMLNALNKPYFNPASAGGTPLGLTTNSFTGNGPTLSGTPTANPTVGTSADSFRLTGLLGDNQARIIQLVFRVRW